MKVLEKGSGQKGWAGEATCTGHGNGGGGCGAKLLVEEGDLYRTYRNYYDGSRDSFTTFSCVECGVETDIVVPGAVGSRLLDKRDWFMGAR